MSTVTTKDKKDAKGLKDTSGPILRVQKWWPVAEQLPDADLRVCVCTLEGAIYEGFTVDDEGNWITDDGFNYVEVETDAIGWWADTTSPLWVDEPVPVKVEVRGGVAEVAECPECIMVEIVDYDNEVRA